MHIAIVNLTGGQFSGGYRKYLLQLVPLLAAEPDVTLDVFNPAGTPPLLAGVARERSVNVRDLRHRPLKRELAALAPDVVFIPTARAVSVPGIPTVCMVRNMEPLVVPFGGNGPADALKNLVRRRMAHDACRRADRIIAVSAYVRDFLTQQWHVDPARIGVVHHGVEAPLPAAAAAPPSGMEQMDAPFIFTAGSIRAARGLDDLIAALAALRERGTSVRAVIAGSDTSHGGRDGTRLRRRIADAGLDAQVTWTGQLSAPEMAWCFRNAAVFVMTTRAEACPNTALEAMAYGACIVATDGPPLPEICGDAATYYRAGDGASLAHRISAALAAPPGERAARADAARARARQFTWAATAQRTLHELRVAITQRAGDSAP